MFEHKMLEHPIKLICPFEMRLAMTPEGLNMRVVVLANKIYPGLQMTKPRRHAKGDALKGNAKGDALIPTTSAFK